MRYIKIMLTLLVAATAALAWVMRPGPPVQVAAPAVVAPNRFGEPLGRMIDSIEIKNMTAEDAVRALHEKTGVDIRVQWETYENSLPPLLHTDRVTLSLSNVNLETALIILLNSNYNATRYAGFTSIGNAVIVRGDAAPTSGMIMRAYDVRDLISDEYWGVKTPPGSETTTENARIHDLEYVIGSYVDTGTFDTMFSGISQGGHTEVFGGRLIITQTETGHQCVANVLAWLRKMR